MANMSKIYDDFVQKRKEHLNEISNFKRREIAFELRHERDDAPTPRSHVTAIHYLKNTGMDPTNPDHVDRMKNRYRAVHNSKSGWHIKVMSHHGNFHDDYIDRAHKDFGKENVRKWTPKT